VQCCVCVVATSLTPQLCTCLTHCECCVVHTAHTTYNTQTGQRVGSKRTRSEAASTDSTIGLVSPPQSPLRSNMIGSVSGSADLLQVPRFSEMNNKDTFNLMAFELTDSDKLLSGSSSTVGLQQRLVLTHSTDKYILYIRSTMYMCSTEVHFCSVYKLI
jgi:hypothetical protein